jgi:transposase InsO family protein
VAPNKFLAKLDSDWRKPDGLFVLRPEEVDPFLLPLPVGRLPGVGTVTEERLLQLGIKAVVNLRKLERAIRVLSVVDAYTRGCLALEVDVSFAGRRVTRVLDGIVAERGQPRAIRCDNGPERTSRHFSGVVCGAADRVGAHTAGQAGAERAHRKFPRTAAG